MNNTNGFRSTVAILLVLALLSGCGAVHQANVRSDVKTMNSNIQASQAECKTEFAVPALDPIRDKVEFLREPPDVAPPFSIMANDTFPADVERAAIGKWAAIRDDCLKRMNASLVVPHATGNDASYLQRRFSAIHDLQANTGYLILALYQQKLTYGEFARKRYEISRDALTALDAMRQAYVDHEQQRQMIAQQQLVNTFAAWSEYMQAVNARQPQTVYLSGTIQVVR
jgi:hypothetical protein